MGSLIITFDDAKAHQLRVSMTSKKYHGSTFEVLVNAATPKHISAFQRFSISEATIPPPKIKTSMAPKQTKSKPHSGVNNMPWFSRYRENPFGVHFRVQEELEVYSHYGRCL